MSRPSIEVVANIANAPETVMSYIADVRNRPFYLSPLKAVSDVRETPSGVGTTWKWTWLALGMEFQGTGVSLKWEPGKVYSFKTEGGIASTWTYTATPDNAGTKLTIRVEYDVPEKAKSKIPAAPVADAMKKTEADRVVQNLKTILDR
jgi:hypothetical protein